MELLIQNQVKIADRLLPINIEKNLISQSGAHFTHFFCHSWSDMFDSQFKHYKFGPEMVAVKWIYSFWSYRINYSHCKIFLNNAECFFELSSFHPCLNFPRNLYKVQDIENLERLPNSSVWKLMEIDFRMQVLINIQCDVKFNTVHSAKDSRPRTDRQFNEHLPEIEPIGFNLSWKP